MAELFLNNGLVAKHFGNRPYLGRRIRGHTKRVYTGVRFAAAWGQGKFIPHEQTVDMVISLHWIKGDNQNGLWRVEATQGFEDIALEWVGQNCGAHFITSGAFAALKKPPAPSVKRRKPQPVAKWNRLPQKVDNG